MTQTDPLVESCRSAHVNKAPLCAFTPSPMEGGLSTSGVKAQTRPGIRTACAVLDSPYALAHEPIVGLRVGMPVRAFSPRAAGIDIPVLARRGIQIYFISAELHCTVVAPEDGVGVVGGGDGPVASAGSRQARGIRRLTDRVDSPARHRHCDSR